MFLRYIVVGVCCAAIAASVRIEHEFRCDYTYNAEVDGWLKLHEIPSNFHEARLRCQLEGGVLASPLHGRLRAAMFTLLEDTKKTQAVFTGISAKFSRGDFYSVEGIPLSRIPHKWAEDEPNNCDNSEQCLVMLSDATLADVSCSDVFPYMCYKKRQPGVLRNNCGTLDAAYTWDARSGHCYKFHSEPRTWARAFMACSAEGAHLAVINSDAEATVIRELFAKNPAGSMPGSFWKDVAFVGFHDYDEHGTWLTVQGQTLEQAGYNKFALMDNATTGEFCGSVFRSAQYNDLWCENKYAFICEKHPESLLCDVDDTNTV